MNFPFRVSIIAVSERITFWMKKKSSSSLKPLSIQASSTTTKNSWNFAIRLIIQRIWFVRSWKKDITKHFSRLDIPIVGHRRFSFALVHRSQKYRETMTRNVPKFNKKTRLQTCFCQFHSSQVARKYLRKQLTECNRSLLMMALRENVKVGLGVQNLFLEKLNKTFLVYFVKSTNFWFFNFL